MSRHNLDRYLAACGMAFCIFFCSANAVAHLGEDSGAVRVLMGWGDEPPYSGSRNAIEVAFTNLHGGAVAYNAAQLTVEVTFGDERIALPLLPRGKQAGKYAAGIVPTRAGTYSFHITGKFNGQSVDVQSMCSEKTFDCVVDSSEIQFPAKDPATGQIAQAVTRAQQRVQQVDDTAMRAVRIAMAAAVVSLIAIGLVLHAKYFRGRLGG